MAIKAKPVEEQTKEEDTLLEKVEAARKKRNKRETELRNQLANQLAAIKTKPVKERTKEEDMLLNKVEAARNKRNKKRREARKKIKKRRLCTEPAAVEPADVMASRAIVAALLQDALAACDSYKAAIADARTTAAAAAAALYPAAVATIAAVPQDTQDALAACNSRQVAAAAALSPIPPIHFHHQSVNTLVTSDSEWVSMYKEGSISSCIMRMLQAYLKRVGEKTGGSKGELVERVNQSIASRLASGKLQDPSFTS